MWQPMQLPVLTLSGATSRAHTGWADRSPPWHDRQVLLYSSVVVAEAGWCASWQVAHVMSLLSKQALRARRMGWESIPTQFGSVSCFLGT
jgi:hypothetical protein